MQPHPSCFLAWALDSAGGGEAGEAGLRVTGTADTGSAGTQAGLWVSHST